MKILHLGLCVQPEPFNGFQTAFIDELGAQNYAELSCGDTDFNNKAVKLFDEFKPDVVFIQIQSEGVINIETLKHFKGSIVINWTGDKRATVPAWIETAAPYVTITAFSNNDDVNYMRSLGFKSEYLEIGFNPLIYTPEGLASPNVPEIVFMGNNYGRGCFPMSGFRIDMVDFLRSEYGDRFGLYGSGWPHALGNANNSQPDEAALYRATKIAINVSHFDSLNYNSDRLLRILGSGVACISYNHKEMFNTYKFNVGYFNTFAELKNEIDYYLNDDYLRQKLAANGCAFVNNNFTFKHQVKNIIKLAL